MQKTINGKRYDTKTASHICAISDKESLFMKKTGECFLFDGKAITPLSTEEALTIAQMYQSVHDFKQFEQRLKFKKSSERIQINPNISVQAFEQLKAISQATTESTSEIVDRAIKRTYTEHCSIAQAINKLANELIKN